MLERRARAPTSTQREARRARVILGCVDSNLAIHVVLDNGSSHVSLHTKAWFAAHPRTARALHAASRLAGQPGRVFLVDPAAQGHRLRTG